MREIVYSEHLKERLKLRELPHDLPQRIYQYATERYRDRETMLFVAIGRRLYRGRMREFVVAYREYGDMVMLITIHPLKPQQKIARIRAGRWTPIP